MFWFCRKPKDWEVWWEGYWRGLKGYGQMTKEYIYRWTQGENFMIFNSGWDEGIEDRGKLNKFIGK